MNPHERTPITSPVDPDEIFKVYTGRAGCGCGCRGNYWEDARNIRRVVKAINARVGDGAAVQTGADGKPFCYFVEDPATRGHADFPSHPGRYMWAYVKGGR